MPQRKRLFKRLAGRRDKYQGDGVNGKQKGRNEVFWGELQGYFGLRSALYFKFLRNRLILFSGNGNQRLHSIQM